ncbi:hypothetical protein [Marinobacter sp.]|uniref:hypothetical protein n=1 Tax=Marinobacter sp. TaxID=50741 RepID=UPI003A906DC9
MNSDEFGSLSTRLIKEGAGRHTQDTIEKMHVLCDKQWHTYELPSLGARKAASHWVHEYLDTASPDPELAAKVVYCFGLNRELLAQIIECYGYYVDLSEYEEDLEHSGGDFVDPYWTLRKGD